MRQRESFSGEYYLFPQLGQDVRPTKYKIIRDVNNGRKRPPSPCYIATCTVRPFPVPFREPSEFNRLGNYNLPVYEYHKYINRISADDANQLRSKIDSILQNERKKLSQSFSTLNFLSELKDVGRLFKRADSTWRHWSEYRSIDYTFGVAPMVADLKNALQHYNSVAKRTEAISKRFRNVPINRMVHAQGNTSGIISFFLGNGHHNDDFWSVRCRVKGELSVAVPRLAQVNPEVFFVLDQLAINPSLANLWEAVPFSWLLDWFLPVGNFLETLPDAMSPDCYFSGTISTKITGHSMVTSVLSPPGYHFLGGYPAGEMHAKIYSREAVSFPLAGKSRWDFMGGINSLPKALVIRDILYPAKRFR